MHEHYDLSICILIFKIDPVINFTTIGNFSNFSNLDTSLTVALVSLINSAHSLFFF